MLNKKHEQAKQRKVFLDFFMKDEEDALIKKGAKARLKIQSLCITRATQALQNEVDLQSNRFYAFYFWEIVLQLSCNIGATMPNKSNKSGYPEMIRLSENKCRHYSVGFFWTISDLNM